MNTIKDLFYKPNKKLISRKYDHYLEIYEVFLSKFQNTKPDILEIGINQGGSLELWNDYFCGNCNIYGVDYKKESCRDIPKKLNAKNIHIELGDQSDRNFWRNYLKDKPLFDIVIEDGGHRMEQQIVTFEEVFCNVKPGGFYICEDLHTNYWPKFGGGYKHGDTFIEYSKNFIDAIHANRITDERSKPLQQPHNIEDLKRLGGMIKSIHYYESALVLEKAHKDYNISEICSNQPPTKL